MIKPINCLLASACGAMTLALSACANGPASDPAIQSVQAQPVTLDLKAGQILQFAMIRPREGNAAKAVRARYFQTAIPYAQSLGDEYLGNLRVKRTMLGENTPRGIALYAFPDAASQQAFQNSPDWDDYQRMRREGWAELHVFSATIPSDMQLTFDPAKDYTLAAAWTRPDTIADYQAYLDGIEADFDMIGARYVAQLNQVTLQSQTDAAGDPSQLTIVEWSDGPDLPGLQRTQGYKDHASDFQTAISRFDLYWITVPDA